MVFAAWHIRTSQQLGGAVCVALQEVIDAVGGCVLPLIKLVCKRVECCLDVSAVGQATRLVTIVCCVPYESTSSADARLMMLDRSTP